MTAAELTEKKVQFEDLELRVIEESGEEWFTAEDIGKALGLTEPRIAVMKIFKRHREEFEGLHRVTKMVTRHKDGISRTLKYTVFNAEGVYLLTLHCHTPRGKKLRLWVSRFLAHDLERLRAHLQEMDERQRHQVQRLRALEKKCRYWQKKAKTMEREVVKCLPPPEPEPYQLGDESMLVRIPAGDLHALVRAAVDAQAHPEYEAPWFQRLLVAQDTPTEDLMKILKGLEALPRILKSVGLRN